MKHSLINRVAALEARAQRRIPHRHVEIIDGGTVPWPGPKPEPWDGTPPSRILIVGVMPKEVHHEH